MQFSTLFSTAAIAAIVAADSVQPEETTTIERVTLYVNLTKTVSTITSYSSVNATTSIPSSSATPAPVSSKNTTIPTSKPSSSSPVANGVGAMELSYGLVCVAAAAALL